MKRIVLLSAFATPFRSGAEAMVEEVSQRLRGRFDITIVTAKLRRNLPRRGELNGIPVLRVGIGYGIDKWLFPFLAPFAARRLRPQIIHAVLESYAGLALALCRWIAPSARRILTCQSTNTTLLVGFMHRSVHVVTAISSVLQERAKRFGKEAVLIPNGVALGELQEAALKNNKDERSILFVGRLEPMKGVDTLLRAFAAIADKEVRLTIVGGGSLRATLEQQVQDLGIAHRVTFCGMLKPNDVYKEYAKAEIFCGLSRSEALGNVFIEAQAAGCAVVATNIGGIPDIVQDGKTGLLISPDDVQAAAGAIGRLLSDVELRLRLQRNGLKNAERYDWGSIAERYASVYDAAN